MFDDLADWRQSYERWKYINHDAARANLTDYPFVENKRAPFCPLKRALPLLNLALISSAGAYIDGTAPFDTEAEDGDLTFREIPSVIEAEDLRFCARGYDPKAIQEDINCQIPLTRLFEFESSNIIGQLNQVFWSLCGFIPDAAGLVEQTLPRLVERVKRYEAQAALLIPASRLCHQTMGLAARALEAAGVPTMMIAVERKVTESVHPPRVGYYKGEFGSVAGRPNWRQYQSRILDEALRLIEPFDEPGIRTLNVEIETQVEIARGEK
jgi:D-proline reductase (dithiol) PrdB